MVLKTCLVLCQQEVPLTFRMLALLKLQVNFPWDDFRFPFILLQVGLAPERAEPSGWQATEQKVTLAQQALQPPPAFLSSHHTEVPVFPWNQICFVDLQALGLLCTRMGSVSFDLLLCHSFLGLPKESTATLSNRGEVQNHEIGRAALTWKLLESFPCLCPFW